MWGKDSVYPAEEFSSSPFGIDLDSERLIDTSKHSIFVEEYCSAADIIGESEDLYTQIWAADELYDSRKTGGLYYPFSGITEWEVVEWLHYRIVGESCCARKFIRHHWTHTTEDVSSIKVSFNMCFCRWMHLILHRSLRDGGTARPRTRLQKSRPTGEPCCLRSPSCFSFPPSPVELSTTYKDLSEVRSIVIISLTI